MGGCSCGYDSPICFLDFPYTVSLIKIKRLAEQGTARINPLNQPENEQAVSVNELMEN
ncbi:small, acid-soluble spore protein, H family [Bacillus sp. B15-48]|nr:small, acid-soluble spore protein, H family [Bacillus sp. B15-48]